MEQEARKGKRGEVRERKRKCGEDSDAGVPLFLPFCHHTPTINFPSLNNIYSSLAHRLSTLGFNAFLRSEFRAVWDKQKDVRWNRNAQRHPLSCIHLSFLKSSCLLDHLCCGSQLILFSLSCALSATGKLSQLRFSFLLLSLPHADRASYAD